MSGNIDRTIRRYLPKCTCEQKSPPNNHQSIPGRTPKVKMARQGRRPQKRPTYYCICDNPPRSCICGKNPALPSRPRQVLRRYVAKSGQRYTFLPGWLVGRLIDIFKEQEKEKRKQKSREPEPNWENLGVKRMEKRKETPANKNLKKQSLPSSKESHQSKDNKHQS